MPEELQAGFAAAAAEGLTVAAVLIVSPSYFGAVARVKELADICHAHNVPLLVDEAHGGHLDLLPAACQQQAQASAAAACQPGADTSCAGLKGSPVSGLHTTLTEGSDTCNSSTPGNHHSNGRCSTDNLCLGALSCGADLVMHSSHKVLTAMTQSAMLHLKGTRVDPSRISKALQALQTSSPSYLLLASLDAARQQATFSGSWQQPLAAAEAARAAVSTLQGVALMQQGGSGQQQESVAGFDPLRLVVNVSKLGLTGYAAAEWLERHHSIVPELATAQGAAELTPRQAFYADTECVPLSEAAGRVSAELLCPYPPGVPLVLPGERLTTAVLQQLKLTLDQGGVVTGASDSKLDHVTVVL
eukprot:gene11658-11801_t